MPAVWPPFEDDDENAEVSIADQVQKIEKLWEQSKTKNADAENLASPSLAKRKPTTVHTVVTHPLQSTSTHIPFESKEKRHRSLLDCLDQTYFTESPTKIKRETILCDIASISTALTSDETSAEARAECCIDIDNVLTSETTEANDNIQKLHIDEEPNEAIQNQTNKLETLHVVSDPGSDMLSNADSSLPDILNGTLSSSESYNCKAKNQRTLMDFFRTK